ncbi:MAG: winged helix-turn-helix domain-containing protein [Planctomycetota bacterium]
MNTSQSKTDKVYDLIRSKIQSGIYPIGSRLPSVAKIGTEYNVAHVTAFRIIRKLAEQGYVRTSSGKGGEKGTFVREKFPGKTITLPKKVATLFLPLEMVRFGDTFWLDILTSIQLNLAQKKIINMNYSIQQEKYLAGFYNELKKGIVDAVIACQFVPEQVLDKISDTGVPILIINHNHPSENISSLIPDYERIGRESAEMMVNSGFQKFYFYRVPKGGKESPAWQEAEFSTHRNIESAFTRNIKKLTGKEVTYIEDVSKAEYMRFIDDFIHEKEAAVLTVSGGLTQILYEKMLIENDDRIKNHGIIWIEDYGTNVSFAPALSAWQLDVNQIGKASLDMLQQIWKTNNTQALTKTLPVNWIERSL